MYFCPNCSYLFDIAKSSKVSKDIEADTRVVIKKLEDNEDLSKYKAEFSKDEMAKNKK